MILKRIVPVISALVILVCMLAVPASAASFDESATLGYVPYMDLEIYCYLIEGCLSISAQDRIVDFKVGDTNTWFTSGDVGYQYSTSYVDPLNMMSTVAFDPSVAAYMVSYTADAFVVPYDSQLFNRLFAVVLPSSSATIDCSFDVIFVDVNGDPQRMPVLFSSNVSANSVFRPFWDYSLSEDLNKKGVVANSLILIENFSLDVSYSNYVSNVHFNLGLAPQPFTVEAFFFDNGIDYGSVPAVGSDLLLGFSDFFSNGVAAFLDVPVFGYFSFGDLLTPFIAIILVLAIFKILT